MEYGVRVAEKELIDIFEPMAGSVNFYYGRIGNGKTYNATADVLELLERGEVVYCNWHINWEGFDERKSRAHIFWYTLIGKKRFFRFKKENLRYFAPDDVDVEFLSSLTDCHVFVDEGQWIFDSYEGRKFSIEKRKLILHTRHLNRSLSIISQRTQAIAVTARGQVNRFFKCEIKARWPWLIFKRTEFQDMVGEDVDESDESIAGTKVYFAKRKVMEAYDTKYLREGVPASQKVEFEAYDTNMLQRLEMFFMHVVFRRPFWSGRSIEAELNAPKNETTQNDTIGDILDARMDVFGALAAVAAKRNKEMRISPYVLDLKTGQVVLPQKRAKDAIVLEYQKGGDARFSARP